VGVTRQSVTGSSISLIADLLFAIVAFDGETVARGDLFPSPKVVRHAESDALKRAPAHHGVLLLELILKRSP
jgi:hypothetical protein